MKRFIQSGILVAAAALLSAPGLAAQLKGNMFRWYVGGQGGVTFFETPSQTRSGIPTAGGSLVITAKRTALMLSVDEAFGDNELTSYIDPSAAGGQRSVTFNDIRKYSAVLMVYPLKSPAQPFIGIGGGIMHLHNPQPAGPFATPDEQANAQRVASELGSTGFGTFVAGLQLQAGGIQLYGMYQITTSPAEGKLLTGPTHAFVGGLRLSLGGAKESITGGE
ncbi:MAG: hypothetical protein ACREL6_03220 [Gemmatimonadales bacterium]